MLNRLRKCPIWQGMIWSFQLQLEWFSVVSSFKHRTETSYTYTNTYITSSFPPVLEPPAVILFMDFLPFVLQPPELSLQFVGWAPVTVKPWQYSASLRAKIHGMPGNFVSCFFKAVVLLVFWFFLLVSMVFSGYISLVYCQLGDYIYHWSHLIGEPETTIDGMVLIGGPQMKH